MTRTEQVTGGWCPNAPVIHAAPAVLPVAPGNLDAKGPGSRSGGTPGRIREGIALAADAIPSVFKNRRLLAFAALFGIVILALAAGETYLIVTAGNAGPFLVSLQIGAETLVLDSRLFLLQLVCLSAFTFLFAALIRYRSRGNSPGPMTIRESFAATGTHTLTLESLAVLMALAGTLLFVVFTRTQFFGKIISDITMTVFYLPYAYYFPNLFGSAIWFSAQVMAIAATEFLLVIGAVPFIVREDAGLLPALAASFRFAKRMWPEILGCVIVCGAIFLVIALTALTIGQSPLLVGHDYDFFLQISRGKILMMAACYGFVAACGVLMATGLAALGIAVADLNSLETTGQVRAGPKTKQDTAAEISQ